MGIHPPSHITKVPLEALGGVAVRNKYSVNERAVAELIAKRKIHTLYGSVVSPSSKGVKKISYYTSKLYSCAFLTKNDQKVLKYVRKIMNT